MPRPTQIWVKRGQTCCDGNKSGDTLISLAVSLSVSFKLLLVCQSLPQQPLLHPWPFRARIINVIIIITEIEMTSKKLKQPHFWYSRAGAGEV